MIPLHLRFRSEKIPLEKFRVAKAQKTLPYLSALKSCGLPGCVSHFLDAHPDRLLVPVELAKTSGFNLDEFGHEALKGHKEIQISKWYQ